MKAKIFIVACLITAAGISRVHADPISIADIKALAKAGLSDAVILSQIRNSQTVFHLSTEELIELKTTGVSQAVIDFMLNTVPGTVPEPAAAPAATPVKEVVAATPPPAPVKEVTVVTPAPTPVQIQEVAVGTSAPGPLIEAVPPAPAPDFVWVSGVWRWRHTRLGFGDWEWLPGYWTRPPYRDAIWMGGGWGHRGWRDDHWH